MATAAVSASTCCDDAGSGVCWGISVTGGRNSLAVEEILCH